MNDDSTKFIVKVMRVSLFTALHCEPAQVELQGKFKIVIYFYSVHLLEIPVKPFQSYDEDVGELSKVSTTLSPNLFV